MRILIFGGLLLCLTVPEVLLYGYLPRLTQDELEEKYGRQVPIIGVDHDRPYS